MRGSPLFNALLAFVAVALFGIPVQRLTRGATATAVAVAVAPAIAAAKAAAQVVKVPITFEFTAAPKAVRVRHLGKVVWSAENPGSRAEAEISLPWPREGVDLLVETNWPDESTLAAMRIVLTNPAGDEQTRSLWGRGQASEVFTFR